MNNELAAAWLDDIVRDIIPNSDLYRKYINQLNEALDLACAALCRTAEDDKAREEGRLVVLPCKECFSEAGDNVYLIYCGEVVEVVHCGLSICPVSGIPYIALAAEDKIFPYRQGDAGHDTDPTDWCTNVCDVAAEEFGKTVFLTRQEAEAALDGGGEQC